MRKLAVVARWLLVFVAAGSLQGCFWFDENFQTQLVGHFYLETTPEGANFLYYDEPHKDVTEPLLTDINEWGVSNNHLVVYQKGNYYLFSTNQTSEELVRQTRVGPLAKKDFRLKLYELTGDSTAQLSSAI
ncbi:hypothetical protein [uncultured Hymenobacter sp.]|uniref:hypothetical protein n=1 Tax=uncultured Hymenobacter sp. TaxID=170016 RepID=UPI0035CB3DC0